MILMSLADKERDIISSTQKIRSQLNDSYKKQDELLKEISILKVSPYILHVSSTAIGPNLLPNQTVVLTATII